MSSLPVEASERLTKICGLFGSSHAGERAAAALKAANLLAEHGVTWGDIIGPAVFADPKAERRARYPDRAGPPERTAPDLPHQRRARLLLWTSGYPFSEFEQSVLTTLIHSRTMSDKQRAILDRCETKAKDWRARQEWAA